MFGQYMEPEGINPSLDYVSAEVCSQKFWTNSPQIRNVNLQYLKAWISEDGEI